MASVNLLDAFGYQWGQNGSIADIQDTQWKTGWSFIGATPPSVEQFNKWGNVFDAKANYLYRQLKAVMDQSAVSPGANNDNSLRDAITLTYAKGRLLNVQRFITSGTYGASAGTKSAIVEIVGGGGGGGGSGTTNASQVSSGAGGAAGSFVRHFVGTMPATAAFTIGAGGAGGAAGATGGAGGTTSILGLTAPGGNGGLSVASAPPYMLIGGTPGGIGTGGSIMNAQGQAGSAAFALATGAFISGGGGPSIYGGGGPGLGTSTSAGNSALSPGAGGGGGICGSSTAGQSGGPGAAGSLVVYEFG